MANEYRIPILTSFQSLLRPKLHWVLLALVGCSVACNKDAVEAKAQKSLPGTRRISSSVIDVHAELASPTAFDLISTFDGAKLVWAPKTETALVVREQSVRKDGVLKGPPVPLLPSSAARGRVTDLVAAQLDRGVAVAWVEQLGDEARAGAFISDARGSPEVVDLGPAWPTGTEHRGNIALAGGRDYALVFVRGAEEPCSEGQSQCFGFGLYRLLPEAAANARGLPLSVPVPCSENSTALAIVEGRWHYSVCTLVATAADTSAPVTTVFNIQFEPEYAAAEQLLPGCRPLGLFEHAGKVWLSADCAGRRRITNATGTPRTSHELSKLALDCSAGEPTLRDGDFALRLGLPRGQLHTLLGPSWVPAHGRAVWTGGALVVASEHDGNLRLTRYTCE